MKGYVAIDVEKGRIKRNEYGAPYVDHDCFVVRMQRKSDLMWEIIAEMKSRESAIAKAESLSKANHDCVFFK